MTVVSIDVSTGVATTRPLTAEELASYPAPPTQAQVLASERAAMKVSRLQARVAMRSAGIFAAVEAAVLSSGNDNMIDAWNSAVEFKRFSPTILALSAQIGLTDTQLDDLFRAAALVDL